MFKKLSTEFMAFLQATGLLVYISVVVLFINFISNNTTDSEEPLYAPVVFLLLFIISAVVSGLLVLAKPAMLFWDKKYKKSVVHLLWTLGWCFVYFAIFTTVVLLSN